MSRHLNPWKLLKFIKDELAEAEGKLQQAALPGRMKKKVSKYERVNSKIQVIVSNFILLENPTKNDVYTALDCLSTCILCLKSIFK